MSGGRNRRVGRYLGICKSVKVVAIRRVDVLVSVAFHQCSNSGPLGLVIVVLDGQRTHLVFVEGKAFQSVDLASFDVETYVMNISRRIRALEDVSQRDGRDLHDGSRVDYFLSRIA